MPTNLEILVVIDPTREDQPALVKAKAIADVSDVAVHVFLCDYLATEEMTDASSTRDGKRLFLKQRKAWLKQVMAEHGCKGKQYSSEVYWNQEWHESVVYAATRRGSRMIIKTTFRHSKTRRVLFKSSDWNLMRHSPCPVLLVKNDKPWPTASRVFAALDLESLDAAHARLNNSVFVAAKRMAAASGMELGIVSAFKKKPENVLVCDADATPESLLAERYGVAPEQVVLSKGAAVKVLSKLVASQNVPLLVIGTIARAGMAGVLVGNTAEKILDKIETDILVLS